MGPVDVDLLRQVDVTLEKNLEFCSSSPGQDFLTQVQALREDFKTHLAWVMKLGRVDDTFSRFAVPNYLVRVLHPLSQSIRLDFLLGKISECFMEVRSLLEQLARCFQADARFPKEKVFSVKLTRLDAVEPRLFKHVEEMDMTMVPFLTELGNGWVKTGQPLTGQTGAAPVPAGAVVYTLKDVNEMARLAESVGKFRVLLSRTLEKWNTKLEK